MVLIISIIIAIYVLLIAWVWNNLGTIDKTKKVLIILVGTVVVYLITLIVFNISKSGINYEEKMMEKDIRSRDSEISELKDKNLKLVEANASLFKQIPTVHEKSESKNEDDELPLKNVSLRSVFDRNGNFIK